MTKIDPEDYYKIYDVNDHKRFIIIKVIRLTLKAPIGVEVRILAVNGFPWVQVGQVGVIRENDLLPDFDAVPLTNTEIILYGEKDE